MNSRYGKFAFLLLAISAPRAQGQSKLFLEGSTPTGTTATQNQAPGAPIQLQTLDPSLTSPEASTTAGQADNAAYVAAQALDAAAQTAATTATLTNVAGGCTPNSCVDSRTDNCGNYNSNCAGASGGGGSSGGGSGGGTRDGSGGFSMSSNGSFMPSTGGGNGINLNGLNIGPNGASGNFGNGLSGGLGAGGQPQSPGGSGGGSVDSSASASY